MGPKMLPTIWGTYMKLVIKYQISAINSCWEKCDKKWAYMFNVYKNQLSRQTGSRNLTGPKTLPTIWYTYMTLVTKYQISTINSYWEKCDEKYLGRTEGQTDRGNSIPPPPSGTRSRRFRIEFGIPNELIRKYSETAWKFGLPFFRSEKVRKFGLKSFLMAEKDAEILTFVIFLGRKKCGNLNFVIFYVGKSSKSWTLSFLLAEKARKVELYHF